MNELTNTNEAGQGNSNALAQFKEDSKNLGVYASDFITSYFPAYGVTNQLAVEFPQENSLDILNSFTFYRICECTVYNVDDKFVYFAEKMQKLFTTAYAIKREVCYGIVSNDGKTSIVLGVQPTSNNETMKVIIEGLLPGVKIEKYTERFSNSVSSSGKVKIDNDRYVGCISGIPALKIDGEYQNKDLSALMRSLNGQNYTIMVLCKPVSEIEIQEKINKAIDIQDKCFAISKRTVSLQKGESTGNTHTGTFNETNGENQNKTKGVNVSGAVPMAAAGAAIGSIIPGVGTVIGAIGGGLIGLFVGKQLGFNSSKTKGTTHSISQGYSDAVTETINSSESISAEVQNSFALELMKMSESMVDRLKVGRSIGMWKSVVTYSSDSQLASDIIKGSLYSEIASGIPEVLPPVVFSYKDSCKNAKDAKKIHTQQLMIPKGFFNGDCDSPLMSLVTSEELCGICTIPTDRTVGFEVKEEKGYSLNADFDVADKAIGYVCEYDRPLSNVAFGFSDEDLNKHTFVCGITGSGKTNTVKTLLMGTDKHFMVVEPAKREYRNIKKKVDVYTLGRPEINCFKINPFYILPGISPQQHIDMLKDLFSASFAFYGPMPYIVEKCLYRIYEKKGWNLTLGFHPQLINIRSQDEFFGQDKIKKQYSNLSHKFLFPTMQDLKDEVDYYIENEMTYEGEVKGNIRSAIKARIDSLCVGTKGYMFNTHDMIDFETLLKNNSILELEGLADDADKAFALGLLIIYVNEYRQINFVIDSSKGLKHLLVIEEAHRLLKNVSTENNEDLGNPKGKAVEHFTNMLAEMRSYGQGVIVAEQIPTKLAPEVIKNSSNKIIHRIVARDDQEVISNTVGVYPEDAIYLGNLKTGYALCHKEGMVQPVIVNIREAESENVLDKKLYDSNLEKKMFEINKSIIENNLSKDISVWAVKTMVSLMKGSSEKAIYAGLEKAVEVIYHKASLNRIILIPGVDRRKCVVESISDEVISLMVSGIFAINNLPDNDFLKLFRECLQVPKKERIEKAQNMLERFYGKKPYKKAVELVAGLTVTEYLDDYDIHNFVKDFALDNDEAFAEEVEKYLKERRKV